MNQPPKETLIELVIADNGSGLVCADWAAGILRAISGSGLRFLVTRAGDSHANRACNQMCNNFLAGPATDLLILDCDLEVTPEHLQMLFSHDVDLVFGTYPKRQPHHEMCMAVLNNGDRPDPETPLWEVRRAGRGFTRIRRALLERMKEDNGGPALRYHNHGRVEWDFWPSGPVAGKYSSIGEGTDEQGFPRREWISEDWAFCDRARELGVPILVDWRVQARHIGQCSFPIRYTEDMLPHILNHFPDHVIGKTWDKLKELRAPSLRWDQIDGWHDAQNDAAFCWLVEQIPNGGRYLEIGSFMGRSAANLWHRALEAGKEIEINCVDTWEGTKSEPCARVQRELIQGCGGDLLKVFRANMRATKTPVRIVQGDSEEAAQHYAHDSLDAVYIDGDHTADAVARDVSVWLPRVKPGGILCGDDWGDGSFGVREGVLRVLPEEKVRTMGRVWIYQVPV